MTQTRLNLIQSLNRPSQMRNCDRSADDQRYIECVHELFARDAGVGALFDVIRDTVVATQDDRTRQTHQLFRLLVECAILISLRIERKKSFDPQMSAAEKLFIHLRAITIKIVHHNPFLSTLNRFRSECTTRRLLARIDVMMSSRFSIDSLTVACFDAAD